jgi:hypothetical protein
LSTLLKNPQLNISRSFALCTTLTHKFTTFGKKVEIVMSLLRLILCPVELLETRRGSWKWVCAFERHLIDRVPVHAYFLLTGCR